MHPTSDLRHAALRLEKCIISARERSSFSAKSTTIFRCVSASGKLFGSMATVHLDYAENGPFPPVPLAPFRCAQINAAKQRA